MIGQLRKIRRARMKLEHDPKGFYIIGGDGYSTSQNFPDEAKAQEALRRERKLDKELKQGVFPTKVSLIVWNY